MTESTSKKFGLITIFNCFKILIVNILKRILTVKHLFIYPSFIYVEEVQNSQEIMSEIIIANLSQEYIDHLKSETLKAENRLKEETKEYEVKSNQFVDATNWKTAIDAYWTKVKKSEEIAEEVFISIHNILVQASKVNANIEYTLDAIKLLVCNVREISRVLEQMTDEYHTLKSQIDKVVARDSSFKKDKIYDKLTLLGDKLSVSGQAAESAITKVLDLVKAIYILHRSIDSEYRQHKDWVVDHVFVEYIDENGILKPLHIYEVPEVVCGEKTVTEPGLEWQIGKLDTLLKAGMPQPDYDMDNYPCQDAEDFVPAFPLKKGQNRYYDVTREQHRMAADKVKEAKQGLEQADTGKRMADSSYKAYKAALDAADGAKTGKK